MTDFIYRGVTPDGKVVEGYHCKTKSEGLHLIADIGSGEWRGILPESLALSTGKPDKNGRMIFGSIPVNGQMSRGGDVCESNNGKSIIFWSEEKARWEQNFFESNLDMDGTYSIRDWCKNRRVIGSQWEEKG